ncbi:hypothetical protein [Calothrix sp. PCC 6303]|uniref:hypothetical protein n=1 Tax=Calothrix sp. PCC 6303 TaxID=1170562 RepID=UPI0002A033D0|nr:hypothetical protein [Calothrix sp. PCC 6303]AFZ02592.1 hypothetical protein Cal6303_3667 [Calothrix sp. PCC 6303]
MLTHHHKSVCLSLISTDLPLWSVMETAATLYEKDRDRFHLLLTAPSEKEDQKVDIPPASSPRLLWLEISPYRVAMTMQGNSQLSYRHLWEQGVYGVSRYWLPAGSSSNQEKICLRNYTKNLNLSGKLLPENLRVEYELWAGKLQLGCYVLNLEIHH